MKKDIMAEYVKLPELEEYKEWFKDHFDLYREDGILQVTMKTKDHVKYNHYGWKRYFL